MIAVIFEVIPKDGKKDHYLDIAADMKPLLSEIDGFISVERFQSLTDLRKMLSVSFFENEEALVQWRNVATHRKGQSVGRKEVFDDYRIRIAHVMRDYGMFERAQAPKDSRDIHD